MIEISVPYTNCFKEHFSEFIEISDAVEIKWTTVLENKVTVPKIFHWSEGILEERFIEKIHQEKLFDFFKKHDINYFSFDFGPGCSRVKDISYPWGGLYIPAAEPLSLSKIHNIVEKRLKEVRLFFSGIISLELINYYPTGAYETVCEPAVIRELIRGHDIFLLLDIGHLKVSCMNMGINFSDYLQQLPLEKVNHIHLSQPRTLDISKLPEDIRMAMNKFLPDDVRLIAYDAHECVSLSDMKQAIDILNISKAEKKYIALEYYKDSNKLLEMYKQLKQMLI